MNTPRLKTGLFTLLIGLSFSIAQEFNATFSSSNDTLIAVYNGTFNATTLSTANTTKLPVRQTTNDLSAASNVNTISTTSTPVNANIFQLKTICTCMMDSLEDSEMITCPNNFKINIVSAVLYDINSTRCERSDASVQAGYITSIKEDLSNFCTGTNCSISESHLINSVDITHKRPDVACLAADIKWFCYQFTTTYSIVSTSNSAYGFTYFFYIITLILSSSCILIGAIFILRRFLMIRRHASQTRTRRATQRAYSAHLAHMNYCNGMNTGNSNIWTCTYAPPAYDHIYESSHPINPPPDYDATMANNMKFHYLKAEDQVVIVYPNQSEQIVHEIQQSQQQQQTVAQQPQDQRVGENQAQGEFSLQPLYITTNVTNSSQVDANEQQLNQIAQSEPRHSNLEVGAINDGQSGQLNLAFKTESSQSLAVDNLPNNEPTGVNSIDSSTVKHELETTTSNTAADPSNLLKAS